MSIDAMKQALEALEMYLRLDTVEDSILLEQVVAPVAIAELRDAIAQAQGPVAWINWSAFTGQKRLGWECESELASQPLYTAPQPAQELVFECPRCGHCCPRQVECMCGICKLKPVNREPVAWRKHYENSGYTYFDKRWGTIPDGAEPLFSD